MPELTAQLTLRGLSWDFALAGFLFLALLVFGISGGRRTLLAFVVSLYIASVLAYGVGEIKNLGDDASQARGIIFLVSSLILTWFFSGTAFTSLFRFSQWGFNAFWQVLAMSILGAGFFIASLLHFLPESIPISSLMSFAFRGDVIYLVWASLPALFLIVLKPEPSEE